MALRGNHYDAAFEAYLRDRRTPYVAVDEQRRALLEHASLKSMDFIVYSPRTHNLLVDVKGRRFPSGGGETGHKWENWATAEDLPALLQWQSVFGQDFRALLVFAYHVLGDRARQEFSSLFEFRKRTYAFYGVWADQYREVMQTRSASWQTVSVPSVAFRDLRIPIGEVL
ncbi:MAG: HYExAFE family protein [Planctomycetales bacterium]